jgi:hypothetical protein
MYYRLIVCQALMESKIIVVTISYDPRVQEDSNDLEDRPIL